MEIAVLVLGLVGFIMSWVVIGAVLCIIALLLGFICLKVKKHKLRVLGKIECIAGIFFSVLGILVAAVLIYGAVTGNSIIKVTNDVINRIEERFGSDDEEQKAPKGADSEAGTGATTDGADVENVDGGEADDATGVSDDTDGVENVGE